MTIRWWPAVCLVAFALLACGCTQADFDTATPLPTMTTVAPSSSVGAAASLADDERHWLAYMREEEKLARDVYNEFYGTWNEPIFRNIAPSEQQHMDAVGRMLDAYGLPDPAAGNGPGEFEDRDLQALYDGLVRNGSVSRVAALEAGRLVEETDIADLDRAIAASRHDDVTAVYRNLRQGSLNHLAAFNNRLATV